MNYLPPICFRPMAYVQPAVSVFVYELVKRQVQLNSKLKQLPVGGFAASGYIRSLAFCMLAGSGTTHYPVERRTAITAVDAYRLSKSFA